MPNGRVLVSYRPIWSQVVGRALFLGACAGIAAAVAHAVVRVVLGGEVVWPAAFVALIVVGAIVFALMLWSGRLNGVDATEFGLAPVPSRSAATLPWQRIGDIRTERRGGRTVIVAYVSGAVPVRLRAPYDAALLGRDRELEQKFFTLRNLWETYRTWTPQVGPSRPA